MLLSNFDRQTVTTVTRTGCSFDPKKIWSQVLRRGSYKGHVAPRGTQCLPMDCSTLPGLLVLVTCWLTARGLNHLQITTCHDLLQSLESLVNVSATCKMLPHYKDSWIEVSNNMIHADDLRYIIHQCGLTWKQLLILFITFSCLGFLVWDGCMGEYGNRKNQSLYPFPEKWGFKCCRTKLVLFLASTNKP